MLFLSYFIKAENKSSPTVLSGLGLGCELFWGAERHELLPLKPDVGCPFPVAPTDHSQPNSGTTAGRSSSCFIDSFHSQIQFSLVNPVGNPALPHMRSHFLIFNINKECTIINRTRELGTMLASSM